MARLDPALAVDLAALEVFAPDLAAAPVLSSALFPAELAFAPAGLFAAAALPPPPFVLPDLAAPALALA